MLLRDPGVEPTLEIISAGLSIAISAYMLFIEKLKEYDISLMDWKFYTDGNVWLTKGEYKWKTTRGTDKIKPIFWLGIWKGFFRVSFFFSTNLLPELLSLPISEKCKAIIIDAKPMGKTRKFTPIVFDVDDESLIDDLCKLAQFKKEI